MACDLKSSIKESIVGKATSYIIKEDEVFIPTTEKRDLQMAYRIAESAVNRVNKEYKGDTFGNPTSINSSYTDGVGVNIHISNKLQEASDIRDGKKEFNRYNPAFYNNDFALLDQEAKQDDVTLNSKTKGLGEVASMKVITPVLENLKKRFNLDYIIEDNPTADWGGQYRVIDGKDVVVINPSAVKLDTPFHEFAHPFVRIIRKTNPALYNSLVKQMRAHETSKDLIEFIDENYKELSDVDKVEEAVVTLIGLYASQSINPNTSSKLIERIEALLEKIIKMLGLKIKPQELPALTLRELGVMMASDLNIDISAAPGLFQPGETSNQKTRKNQSKDIKFEQQFVFLKRRISRLERRLKTLEEDSSEYLATQDELSYVTANFERAQTTQEESIYKELGEHALEKAEGYINELKDGTKELNAYGIEYTIDTVEAWEEFPELESRAAAIKRSLEPYINKYVLGKVNEFATEKEGVTQEDINSQTKDINRFTKGTGSLSDVTNYLARTIGSIIKATQNTISTKNKQLTASVQTHVNELHDWAKKNGVESKDMYNIFIQEEHGTLKLTKPYNEDGTVNSNYTTIQNTPELKKFYDFYQSTIAQAENSLPTKVGKYFIPNIKKDSLKESLKNIIPTKEFEEGDLVAKEHLYSDALDVQYTKKMAADKKSRDLGASLLKFAAFANNYEGMTKILPEVRLLQEELGSKKYVKSSNPNTAVLGTESNLYKMVDDVINMQVLGEMKKDEGKLKLGDLYDENGNIVGEKYTHGSDVVDTALKYNSLLRIGLSPVTAFTNVIFGDISNLLEAFGSRYFGVKDLHNATSIFFKQTFDKKSVLNKLLEELNPLQELDDYDQINQVKLKGPLDYEKAQELMYAPQKKGEKFLQSRTMLALMIKEGYLTKEGELTPKYLEASTKEKLELSDKIQRVNQMIHGRYTQREAATLQQYALYRLASQFRKWIPAAIENRIGSKQYDNRLQSEVEGRYRTFAKLVWNLKDTQKRLAAGELTELEVYNMKKMLTEVIMWAAVTLMYAGLKGDDDDKKRRKNPWVKTGLTLLNRAAGDLSYFYNPKELNKLASNAIPLSKTVGDVIQTIEYIPHAFYIGDSQYKRGSHKGMNKFYTSAGKTIPGIRPILDVARLANSEELEEFK